MEANIADLRAVKESRVLKIKITEQVEISNKQYLVANDQYADYRVLLINNQLLATDILLVTPQQAQALNVQERDEVRVLALEKMENN